MEAEQWDLGVRSKKSSRFAGNKGRNGKKIGKQRILNTRRGWLALYETINCGKVISSRAVVDFFSIILSVTVRILGKGVTRKQTC